jgi:glycosyltransferase involved in cell wall biosynthesis
MLLYCSFYEWFGLPPLEAMQADTPVIASNVSSIPEVVGDAALLIDPHKIGQISEAIIRLDNDQELRRTLVEKGRERYQSFRWEDTASQTREVFGETVERV